MFPDFFQTIYFGNTLESYCWFIGIILTGLILKKLLSRILTGFVFKIIKKYSPGIGFEQFFSLVTKPIELFILLLTIYLAFDRLEFPEHWKLVPKETFGIKMIIFTTFQVGIVLSITWILLRIVDFFGLIMKQRAAISESKTADQLIPFVKESIKIVLIILSIFFIMGAVFHLNIASLIAGLGIGGLAVALAAKESLENLLGSFTIFLDKPFALGDQVQIGTITGDVEKIGFRSTRIRTAEKSFVTVPNKKMVEAELDNLSRRTCLRVKFNIGLTYDTPASEMKAIVQELQQLLDQHPKLTKNESKVRFHEFGSSSLEILILYFVNSTNWDVYSKVREEINYRIIEIVCNHNCNFAFPTTTVHVERKDNPVVP